MYLRFSCSRRSCLDSFLIHPFFFFNDTATTEIYTLSLHDALPIFLVQHVDLHLQHLALADARRVRTRFAVRSEEHTSELQSRENLVCRLLLEKKKKEKLPKSRLLKIIRREYKSLSSVRRRVITTYW